MIVIFSDLASLYRLKKIKRIEAVGVVEVIGCGEELLRNFCDGRRWWLEGAQS